MFEQSRNPRKTTQQGARAAVVSGALLVASLVVVPALALTIVGTDRPDTLRGTPKADKILGRGGNDRVFGLAGSDVLIGGSGRDLVDGGPGNDRLLVRDGERDTAICGPGRDTVVADRVDVARRDCETVLRPPPSPPAPRAIDITVADQLEVVSDWTSDRCEALDIPDLPARAFRDVAGRVQLISAHFVNRRFVGPDLDHLAHGCEVVMRSDSNPDPSAFNDREWIAAPYTPDGKTVYALLHDEYQGNTHPGRCPSGEYTKCWYNAVTLAVSTDEGSTYVDALPRLVASVPYGYVPDDGPVGVFTPSNIVHNDRDGFYYALVYVNLRDSYIGNCLIRTRNLADAGSWRAWSGGSSFSMTFIDPYGPNPNPADHLCMPVSRWAPRDLQPNSLTWSTEARQWLLVGQAVEGAYFSLSADLINWTRPRLFFRAQVTWDYRCGDPDPIAYPSLIDPSSVSRNFETVGQRAYLYYTQFHYTSCQQTLDRDLVRVPVEIRSG
jgi:hemolysin type calcium-binding protein